MGVQTQSFIRDPFIARLADEDDDKLGGLLSAFHLRVTAFFLHSFTSLVQNNSWLLQPLQDQERGFLPRPLFGFGITPAHPCHWCHCPSSSLLFLIFQYLRRGSLCHCSLLPIFTARVPMPLLILPNTRHCLYQ